MKYLKSIYLLLSCTLVWGACTDDEPDYGTSGIAINAPTTVEVSSSVVTLSSTIQVRNDVRYTSTGFCYATHSAPTIYNATVKANVEEGSITSSLTGLAVNTTYYVRAFACVYEGDVVYSPEISFSTAEGSLEEQLAAYKAPSYADDYTSIASWDNRGKWNLANVHDPTVMKADDGYYYMYQTDASYGNAHSGNGHFHARRSKDLVNWEFLGATMSETAPTWIKEKLNAYRAEMGLAPIENPSYGFWAPVARKVSTGKYRMYYSIVITNYIKTGAPDNTAFDGSWGERAFIGLMETSDPASNIWEDKGLVVCSASDKGKTEYTRSSTNDWNAYFKINAIDPSYIITEKGEHWLIYGSWHSGIAALELNPADGMPKKALGKPWDITGDDNSGYGKIIAQRGSSRWQATEGPEIVYHDGYYYLFLAYGTLAVEYNTRVCRSTSINGTYVDMYGNTAIGSAQLYPVLTAPYKFNNSYGWVGISHCAIFDDGNGNWFYSSQGRFPENVGSNEYSNAIMMGHIRSICWTEDGWPLVMPERYGAVPKAPIREEEIAGNWEHLALNSSTSSQKTSETLTFDLETHKITSGSWNNATWTFDAEKQTVTTSAGVILHLQREVDWEASPRKHSIVYAAQGNQKTYWGKKVQ